MRTAFLILVVALFSSIVTQAQKNYIPLKEFQGDTVRYMIVNFYENKERYIGQKVDSLFKDLEFEISTTFILKVDPMDNFKAKGLKFSHHNRHQKLTLWKKNGSFYLLVIKFAPPYIKTFSDWRKIGGAYWKQAYRDYVNEYIIEDIQLSKYRAPGKIRP